jgi:hypothetical protein
MLVAMCFVEVLSRRSDTVARVDGLSALHHDGGAIEAGLEPGTFLGLTAARTAFAAAGCLRVERRDVRQSHQKEPP